ncbi:ABC transporter substrate-binding protein [Rubritalea tangerina]|uniref:ABC transporter substrate-binding protein n=1 Tax=Rubritalea tangerina TaxID=430798 RepID=A0ABW4Z9C6_9BACT
MRRIHNEYLDHRFEVPEEPKRVVCLVSSATEAMDSMGFHERIVGVSEYCDRYIDTTGIPVVGQYITADFEKIKDLDADLVLLTTGIQRRLSLKLAEQGVPIYNLNLPNSFSGMLENVILLGGLLNELDAARGLASKMAERFASIKRACEGGKRPRVYVELWLGRHRRAVGGLSYIRDLVECAGGELVYGERAVGYFENDLGELMHERPDVYVFFHEPEYLVDGELLVHEREWDTRIPVVMSTVKMGENMIQDGPSLLDSAEWLQARMKEVGAC